jgi:hypothetical protein
MSSRLLELLELRERLELLEWLGRDPLEVLVQVLELVLLLVLVLGLVLQLEPLLRNERRLGRGLCSQAVGRLQSPEGSVSPRRGWRVELHRCRKRA